MAEYSNLSATINAQIRANGVQAITGPVLNAVLTAMVNVLGDGYRLNGVAAPADNPGSPDNRVAYLAAQDGTYTNFGGLTISGEVALLLWDSVWTKATLFSIDTAVTPGSGNLVTSGAVDSALTTLAGTIAAAYMQLVPAASEGNLAKFDNAGQVRDAGVATADIATKDGAFPDLFAGYAGNLVDTRSAGTPQGPYAFRQSGGDGVDYMVRIKGKTEAFNQLVGPSDTQVTIPSGHLYYAIINGTASVGTSDGTPISVTGGVDIVVDLTLEGLGLTTADQFRALHPLGYYNYNAGELKNNAATGLETRGFNQWDEEWESGGLDNNGQPTIDPNKIRSKNYIPVIGGQTYYAKFPQGMIVHYYDNNKGSISEDIWGNGATKVMPANCAFIKFYPYPGNMTTYNHDICINLSDASRNGTYEPYWKRTLALGLNSIACHDENNNAVVVNGLDGVGTSYDEAVVENGMVTKIIKRFAEVDLGTLGWQGFGGGLFGVTFPSMYYESDANTIGCIICTKYVVDTAANVVNLINDKRIGVNNAATNNLVVCDTTYSDAAAFKTAMAGVKLRYELATPKVLTVDTPFPAFVEVDNLGTERRLPEDTADNPQAPFECDSNYSVSTANLVRLLNL